MLRRALLWGFRVIHRVDRWLRRRLTVPGFTALSLCGAGAVFAVDIRSTVSYQLFAVLAGIFVVSSASIVFFRGRFTVQRLLPKYATVGEPLSYRVRIRNHRAHSHAGLLITEILQETLPSYKDFRRTPNGHVRHANLIERYIGYPKWSWLVKQNRGADTEEVMVPSVEAHATTDVTIRLVALRRGYIQLRAIRISRPDPFGLVKAIKSVVSPDSLLVLPRRYPVNWKELQGKTPLRDEGMSSANAWGESDEFSAIREYRPGDALRKIHWRSWARLGEPIVKEFQDENYIRHALLLDNLMPDVSPQLFEEAVSVAASFIDEHADRIGSRIDLLFMGQDAQMLSAGSGIARSELLMEALAVVAPVEGDFKQLSQLVMRTSSGVSACVLVLLGWDDDRQALVKQLRQAQINVLVMVLGQSEQAADLGPMTDQPERFHCLDGSRVAETLSSLSDLRRRLP